MENTIFVDVLSLRRRPLDRDALRAIDESAGGLGRRPDTRC
jgi:hypothetical protein